MNKETKERSRWDIVFRYVVGEERGGLEGYTDAVEYDKRAQHIYKRTNLARGVADVIENNLSKRRGGCIIDIGAGTGILSMELGRRGFHTIAFDLLKQPLELVQEKMQAYQLEHVIDVVQGDMNNPWPFAEGVFDAAVSLRATRYITDFGQWLVEVRRVLAPGGMLILPVFFIDVIPWKRSSAKGIFQKTTVSSMLYSVAISGFEIDKKASGPYTKVVNISQGKRAVPFYYQPTFIVAKKP